MATRPGPTSEHPTQYNGSHAHHGGGPDEQQPDRASRFRKRHQHGDSPRWWFASTAIPLLAATLGPLANVSSISALVSSWRATIFIDGEWVSVFAGKAYADPDWCYGLNAASLICGFLGNFFLLLNFTQRIRYLIALPATIILWYLSTAFLMAATISIEIYDPPQRPQQIYTQAFWYAVAAACLYLICSMLLMVNMLGYFLGRYPDTFRLTDAQRTLILQTMFFFAWLAGGAAVFSAVEQQAGQEGWGFSDALYFCDVTILTVGFGDLYPTTNLGRGLILPYSVFGIVVLGLVISSIYRFMRQMGAENFIHKRFERTRQRTIEGTTIIPSDLRKRDRAVRHLTRRREGIRGESISESKQGHVLGVPVKAIPPPLRGIARPMTKKPRPVLLLESHERFQAMRDIQHRTRRLKKWYAVLFSLTAFGVLWCVGAVVFWRVESRVQSMTYFQALYFCYISLLTIGYGDCSPESNQGRVFFVIWSLVAVPTMTILVSHMGDTVVSKFRQWSNKLAEFTVLPKEGVYRIFTNRLPRFWKQLQSWKISGGLRRGSQVAVLGSVGVHSGGQEDDGEGEGHEIATARASSSSHPDPFCPDTSSVSRSRRHHSPPMTPSTLATALALAIQSIAADLSSLDDKCYTYEEWVQLTRLIRLSTQTIGQTDAEDEEEGVVDWDWIGDDSPLISGLSEAQWLLNKLCDALVRVEKRKSEEGRGGAGECVSREGSSKERSRSENGNGKRQVLKQDGVAEAGIAGAMSVADNQASHNSAGGDAGQPA